MRVVSAQPAPSLDVVLPVYNEEHVLPGSTRRLHEFLAGSIAIPWRIVIVDNGSTDETWRTAQELRDSLPNVAALHLNDRGRGRALRTAWGQSDADVLSYMDIDLSTRLNGFAPLVSAVLSGHSDVAIGSRLIHGARVSRRRRREVLSRSYSRLVRLTMLSHVKDGQCGFKALSASAARVLLPRLRSTGWFFDTELLVLAERMGMRVLEIPVDWIEDLDSRVRLPGAVFEAVQELWAMRWRFWFSTETRGVSSPRRQGVSEG